MGCNRRLHRQRGAQDSGRRTAFRRVLRMQVKACFGAQLGRADGPVAPARVDGMGAAVRRSGVDGRHGEQAAGDLAAPSRSRKSTLPPGLLPALQRRSRPIGTWTWREHFVLPGRTSAERMTEQAAGQRAAHDDPGTGSAVPERELTNDDLSKPVDTSDAGSASALESPRGVVKKRRGGIGSGGCRGASRALRGGDLAAGDRLHYLRDDQRDMTLPSCAVCVTAAQGQCRGALPGFRSSSGVRRFLYGLAVAEGPLRSGPVPPHPPCGGVEVPSGYVNWQDRNTCILFGDGAGGRRCSGWLMRRSRRTGAAFFRPSVRRRQSAEPLTIPGGGSLYPTSADAGRWQALHPHGRQGHLYPCGAQTSLRHARRRS